MLREDWCVVLNWGEHWLNYKGIINVCIANEGCKLSNSLLFRKRMANRLVLPLELDFLLLAEKCMCSLLLYCYASEVECHDEIEYFDTGNIDNVVKSRICKLEWTLVLIFKVYEKGSKWSWTLSCAGRQLIDFITHRGNSYLLAYGYTYNHLWGWN